MNMFHLLRNRIQILQNQMMNLIIVLLEKD
nr:MAG TPA: hypothetical protein [Caudoviricetes sp.]DAX10977.1 MAG TPA: hypothetical protein [Bacteriophage sp.]